MIISRYFATVIARFAVIAIAKPICFEYIVVIIRVIVITSLQ